MSGPSVREVLEGMRVVSSNLAQHFAEIDPDRALGYRQEVEAIDAAVALIAADKEYDKANSDFYNSSNDDDIEASCRAFDAARNRRAAALASLEPKP